MSWLYLVANYGPLIDWNYLGIYLVEKTNDINKLDIVIVDWVWLQLGLNDLLWRDHRVEETSDIEKLDIDQLIVLRCQL